MRKNTNTDKAAADKAAADKAAADKAAADKAAAEKAAADKAAADKAGQEDNSNEVEKLKAELDAEKEANKQLKGELKKAGQKTSPFKTWHAAIDHYMKKGMSYPAAYKKCDEDHAELADTV